MKLNSAMLMLLLLLSITFGTAYITQMASADEAVVKPIEIGLYWDEECTNPVSSINFGMVAKGESKAVTFRLKNLSMDKGLISWDSANFNPSCDGIAQTWERMVGNFLYIANWNKKMKTGDLWEVHYTIKVAQDSPVGNYSWDLVVCFVVSHKISYLSVSCILTVTE